MIFRSSNRTVRWLSQKVIDTSVIQLQQISMQKGDFMGMPPTNEEIAMDGIAIYRVENGKLKERWVVYDLFAMVEQVKAFVNAEYNSLFTLESLLIDLKSNEVRMLAHKK